jgi:hypothetical protein
MNKNNQKKDKIIPYKQRVLGSNPCAPTTMTRVSEDFLLKPFFISIKDILIFPVALRSFIEFHDYHLFKFKDEHNTINNLSFLSLAMAA